MHIFSRVKFIYLVHEDVIGCVQQKKMQFDKCLVILYYDWFLYLLLDQKRTKGKNQSY